jgi:hypothetical protein
MYDRMTFSSQRGNPWLRASEIGSGQEEPMQAWIPGKRGAYGFEGR